MTERLPKTLKVRIVLCIKILYTRYYINMHLKVFKIYLLNARAFRTSFFAHLQIKHFNFKKYSTNVKEKMRCTRMILFQLRQKIYMKIELNAMVSIKRNLPLTSHWNKFFVPFNAVNFRQSPIQSSFIHHAVSGTITI